MNLALIFERKIFQSSNILQFSEIYQWLGRVTAAALAILYVVYWFCISYCHSPCSAVNWCIFCCSC